MQETIRNLTMNPYSYQISPHFIVFVNNWICKKKDEIDKFV